MPTTLPNSVRLYGILARKSTKAVIFRRGPSRRVLLISWDTETDTFTPGQWLRARIYERRCDLSPRGDLLLYFAANFRKPLYSWSAISRPPYLKALALWPKGDCWGGGGLFASPNHILLNHRSNEFNLAPDAELPLWLTVRPFGDRPGWGEDNPVWSERLERDGWMSVYPESQCDTRKQGRRWWYVFSPAITWRKPNPRLPQYALEMAITGLKEQNGPWYLIEHRIVLSGKLIHDIGRSDWADWAHNGDLLFAKAGRVYRLRHTGGELNPSAAVELADFSALQFEAVKAPDEYAVWPQDVVE